MSDPTYTDFERMALTAILDILIPPSADGRLPGAGELGLARVLEREVPALTPLVSKAVAELDEIARAGRAERFADLEPPARAEALRTHQARDPGLVPGLLFQIYAHYYTEPRVLEALGLEARPPWPRGYDLEQPELDALLAPVRAAGRRWRGA